MTNAKTKLSKALLDAFENAVDSEGINEYLPEKKPHYGGGKIFKFENFEVRAIHEHGGGEGDGEEYWAVLEVKDTANNSVSFWKIPGWYQSYDGCNLEWSNIHQVELVEKTVKVWEKISTKNGNKSPQVQ